MSEKKKFHEKINERYELENKNEVLVCLRDFEGYIGENGFEGVHGVLE